MRRPSSNQTTPATRLQIERLAILRTLLRHGGGRAADIAEELGVSERTVRRDLEFVRTRLEWPVRYSADRRRWLLDGEAPPLPSLPLSEQERIALLVAARALEAYRGTPYEAALRTGFVKILAALDTDQSIAAVDPYRLPLFELGPVRKVDPALLQALQSACKEQRRLRLVYRTPSTGDVTTRIVDPYHLINHAGDWYLIAYCHLRRSTRQFAVGGRMQCVDETGDHFLPDPDWDLKDYLKTGFELFRAGRVEIVVLRFHPTQAPYIRERTWADSEAKEDLPDGSLILTLTVPVNIGLERFILRYGAGVEVLRPASLRRRIADIHAAALALYEPNRNARGEGDTG